MAIEHPDHADINTLGELPRQIREERDELYGREPEPGGPPGIIEQIPGSARPQPPPPPLMPSPRDVSGQNAALFDAARAPIGLPATDFLVQTTYDARPINGNDFRAENIVFLAPLLDPPINTADFPFDVPDGRVAVLRNIAWESSVVLAQPTGDPETDSLQIELFEPYSVALIVAGTIQRTYERIFRQEWTEEVYAIASVGEQIILRVTINSDFAGTIPAGYTPKITFTMRGNLLDIKGRERQYEPANQYAGDLLK